MKVSTGHPVQGTDEASAEVAKGNTQKSMPKSTVEKEQLSHRKIQNTRKDTPVGHGALIMRPDGE